MTEHDYRLQRAKIQRELETAQNLGCKRVIADCNHRLQKLEWEFTRGVEMTQRYDTIPFETIIKDDALLPNMKFVVSFADGSKSVVETYYKLKEGVDRKDIETDFIESLNATLLQNKPRAVSAHLIPLRGGRLSDFELACKRVGERWDALHLDRLYR